MRDLSSGDSSSTTASGKVDYGKGAGKIASGNLVKVKNSYKVASVAPKSVLTKPTKPKASMKPRGNVIKSVVSLSKAKVDTKTKSKPADKPKAKLSLAKPKKATALKPKIAAKAKKETDPKIKSRGECCRSCLKLSQT
jgi:hypothetical protein